MDNDEIIIEVNKRVPASNKKQKKKKAVNKTASKNMKKSDKNNVRSFNNIKHKSNKKRLKVLMIIILIIVSLILLLSSSLFNIKEITVEGNQKLSGQEVISLSGIEKSKNIFAISKIVSSSRIEENTYIDTVNIKRVLPNIIKIIVKERTPAYMLHYADSLVYISRQGHILEIANEKLSIPILTGTTTDLNNIKIGNKVNVEDLKVLNIVNSIIDLSNNNDIGDLITYIDVTDTKNYKLIMESEGKTVYLGDGSELNIRILHLKPILDETAGENGEIFLNIDLNTERARFKKST